MKIKDMVSLIDEMVTILKHNEVIYINARQQGYQGFYPSYEKRQQFLLETKNELVALDEQGLSDEYQQKLEQAASYFCLGHLVHGARNDELYLCKLKHTDAKNIFQGMEDTTSSLATKYDLLLAKRVGSDFYFNEFNALIDEIKSENQHSMSRMGPS